MTILTRRTVTHLSFGRIGGIKIPLGAFIVPIALFLLPAVLDLAVEFLSEIDRRLRGLLEIIPWRHRLPLRLGLGRMQGFLDAVEEAGEFAFFRLGLRLHGAAIVGAGPLQDRRLRGAVEFRLQRFTDLDDLLRDALEFLAMQRRFGRAVLARGEGLKGVTPAVDLLQLAVVLS